jgi:hypothetical protein
MVCPFTACPGAEGGGAERQFQLSGIWLRPDRRDGLVVI